MRVCLGLREPPHRGQTSLFDGGHQIASPLDVVVPHRRQAEAEFMAHDRAGGSGVYDGALYLQDNNMAKPKGIPPSMGFPIMPHSRYARLLKKLTF